MTTPKTGTRHAGLPPGYVDATGAAEMLRLGRRTIYTGYLDILDSWQNGPRTPRLFRRGDVALVERWLWARRGMVALGLWPSSTPRIPERGMDDIRNFLGEAEYEWSCPTCDGRAIADAMGDGRTWCEVCGLQAAPPD